MLGPRYYALSEKMGADRMAGLVERLKCVKQLKDALRALDLNKSITTERKENRHLLRDIAQTMPGEGTLNGRLRDSFLEPLLRMKLIEEEEVEEEFPDTPPPEPEDEEEEVVIILLKKCDRYVKNRWL
jgi:hypothetical protein